MDTILQRLTDLDEITGALIIGKDGLIVSGALPGDDEDMLGAMSAAVFGSIADFTLQAVHGETRHAIIETDTGTVQFATVGDLILVITTGPNSNSGRVRLEMKKASQQLAALVAAYYPYTTRCCWLTASGNLSRHRSSSVGTGGRVEWMRGPCACPSSRCDTFTSQSSDESCCHEGQAQGPRPAISSTPCPYRMANVFISSTQSAKLIKDMGGCLTDRQTIVVIH